MSSEWEQLEGLSKDELIIELVKARTDFRNLKLMLRDLSEDGGQWGCLGEGSKPSKKWLRKIGDYVLSKTEDRDYIDEIDLMRYGVSEESSKKFLKKHYSRDRDPE